MLVMQRVAPRALLLLGLLQHALAMPTAANPAHALMLRGDYLPISTMPTSALQCPRMDKADHQVTIEVGEALDHVSTKEKVLAMWKGIDKVQLAAAMASILGEASLGKILLDDDSAVTDGLLAVPTILVSLLSGVKALQPLMDPNNKGDWKGIPGLDMLEFGTQASIWTVCIVLMFQGILTTGFNGITTPEHYTIALATHASFLGLNIAQGVWEMSKTANFGAGTGRLLDSLTLAGWKVSHQTKRMMSGMINFASTILRRQQTAVNQAGRDAAKLEHFVPLTRELARIALEVDAVGQCMMDSADFHDRTSKLQRGKPIEQCRAEWKTKFGHIYQNSGPAKGDEDSRLGQHAEMVRLTTLQDMTGSEKEDSGSMLQAIVMDGVGNIVPAVVFSAMVAVTGGRSDAHGTEAGIAIFGATTALQSLFIGKSSKALYQMFREAGEENPKAKELAETVNHELQSGSLKEYGDLGVEIDVMVLSSTAKDYERHQGRFSIHNCPAHKKKALETKLLSLATKAKVLRPEVFADTPQRFFGKMFRYSEDGPSGGRPSGVGHVRRANPKKHSKGGARVMTWESFNGLFKGVDIGIIFEQLKLVDPCVKGVKAREEPEFVPWSMLPENRARALQEGVSQLEEDPRW